MIVADSQIWHWQTSFLFPYHKLALKDLCFADIADIMQHIIMILRAIPQEAFSDSFKTNDWSMLYQMVINLKANKIFSL